MSSTRTESPTGSDTAEHAFSSAPSNFPPGKQMLSFTHSSWIGQKALEIRQAISMLISTACASLLVARAGSILWTNDDGYSKECRSERVSLSVRTQRGLSQRRTRVNGAQSN
jgi:hypothetical protein